MGRIIVKTIKDGYREGGIAVAILVCLLMLGIVFGLMCGVIGIAMALWNGCLVALFPMIPEITFWQMWGLYLLFDILIKPTIPSNEEED